MANVGRFSRGAVLAPPSAMRSSWILVVIALAGCESRAAPQRRDEPFDSLVKKVIETKHRMHQRFVATDTIRTAISLGDTESARAAARTIETLDEPEILPEWRPYLADLRAAAAQVAVATDPVTEAKAFALVGLRCAQCHQASAARIAFPTVPGPRDKPQVAGQMAAHAWAAARMWEGLIGPSPVLWRAGAESLSDARLTIVADGDVPGHELGIGDDVARVRLLATRAKSVDTLEDRAEIYGEVLATCVRCHAAIRDR